MSAAVDMFATIGEGNRALRAHFRETARDAYVQALAAVREAQAYERAAASATSQETPAVLRLRATCAYTLALIHIDFARYWRQFATIERRRARERAEMLRGRIS